jgi:hypothetical protein
MASACDTSGVIVVNPDVSVDPDRSVTIAVSVEDSTLADRLGWHTGVPGVEVSLMRVGLPFGPQVALTDSLGRARFDQVIDGQYQIGAYLVLEDSRAETPRALADGLTTWVYPPAEIRLSLRLDQPGSLVFSEIYGAPTLYLDKYQWYQYFDIYNNADTTVYLDGMLWGQAWDADRDFTPLPCSLSEPLRADALGLWATYFHQFPGGGSEYPIGPGETVTVALDAVDHSAVSPEFPNLAAADFELQGTADVDNPDVPNRWSPYGGESSCASRRRPYSTS